MRVIRILVVLSMLAAMLVPYLTSATQAETVDSNEIKINFKIEDNLTINDGVVRGRYISLANTPYNFEGYVPVKTKEELKREMILSKFEEKRKKASYPQGKFIINASAYTAAADECGKSDGITASGLKVKVKETIACPREFPFGTKLNIEGMGTYICQDRGGAIKGNHIDIYMETKKEAFAFGRKNLLAEVIM